MASLSSLPISIEGSTAEGATLSGFRILAAIRPGNSVDFVGLGDRRGRCLKTSWVSNNSRWVLGSERLGRSCRSRESARESRRIVHLRASEKDAAEGDNDSDDALEAAIKKSKNLMAMQKELLQQIAERKKIVANIKDSVGDSVDGDTSSKETETFDLDLSTSNNKVQSMEFADSSLSYSSSNTKAFDGKYDGGQNTTRNASSGRKVPDNSTPVPSVNSGKQTGKLTGSSIPKAYPEKVEDKLDSSRRRLNESIIPTKSDSARSSPYYNGARDVGAAGKADKTSSPQAFRSTSTVASSPREGKFEESLSAGKTGETDDPSGEDVMPPPLAGSNVMNVILVAAECSPWKKTGGLGDVAGALPKALARRGHRVMVVVPRYGDYAEPQDIGVRKRYMVAGQDMEVSYFHAYIDGVDFVFIDSPIFRHIENDIYGGSRMDVLKRMALFCKAAVEVPWHVPCGGVCYGDGNLVFIANDWHTALLPVYLKAYYRDNGLMKFTRSVLVIHNIAHQGRGPVEDFKVVDLPEHYLDIFKLYDPVGGEHFNIFAAGLKAADRIVTVSNGYSWEVKTLEGGWGLHHIINENDWKFRGIVNGIDYKEWSPQSDEHLKSDGYINYSMETLKTGKAQCKEALQKELGLPVRPEVPLIGFIGRLDAQKGVDIIAEAIPWMMGQDVQLVMLGSGRPDLEQMLRNFENQHKDCIRGWVGFSVKMAHRITAGADILLMPSRFEPCGLNQLYAMCYGTIPVVHGVGGLRDTVLPFDPFSETGYGWTFDRAESGRLIHALGNCLLTFREYKNSWEGLQRRGMEQDLSWDNAAQLYEEVLVAAKYQW